MRLEQRIDNYVRETNFPVASLFLKMAVSLEFGLWAMTTG